MGDLSEHFSTPEIACKDGCGFNDPVKCHIDNMEKLRNQINIDYPAEDGSSRKIVVVSGNRCKDHNKAVGGASKSRHIEGDGWDITSPGLTPDQIIRSAEKIGPIVGTPGKREGFGGLGVGHNIAHVDSRPRKKPSSRYPGARARWTYGGKAFKWSE
jgi:hypothetical protein